MSLRQSRASDLAFTPSLGVRALGGFGTSIAVGGRPRCGRLDARTSSAFPWTALLPFNAIGAWVAVAFALGASARTIPTGALRGVIGLLSAVAAYYVLNALFSVRGFRAIGASHAATVWGAVALLAGPAFGWRVPRGGTGAAGRGRSEWRRLSAALIAEGLVFGAQRLVHIGQLAQRSGRDRPRGGDRCLASRCRGCCCAAASVAPGTRRSSSWLSSLPSRSVR